MLFINIEHYKIGISVNINITILGVIQIIRDTLSRGGEGQTMCHILFSLFETQFLRPFEVKTFVKHQD